MNEAEYKCSLNVSYEELWRSRRVLAVEAVLAEADNTLRDLHTKAEFKNCFVIH